MIAYGVPLVATLALWWGSTGLILHLDSQDRRTFVASMMGATALVALSLWLVARHPRNDADLRLCRLCLRHRVVGRHNSSRLTPVLSPARIRPLIPPTPTWRHVSVKPPTRVVS